MAGLFKFLIRIVGLKHIKFLESGIYLAEFPMFLLPLELYYDLLIQLNKSIGEKNTKEIIYNVALSQGKFGVNYFKNKYNIFVNKDDFSFYLEQTQSIGLGEIDFKKISKDKKELLIHSKSSINFENKIHDYYLEGLANGACSILFNKNYKSSAKKISNNEFLYKYIENNSNNFNQIKNYTFKNILNISKNKKHNLFVEKLKKLNKNLFYSNVTGTFFNKKKYMFTLFSVLVSIYYLSILKDDKSRKVFLNFGEKIGNFIYRDYSKYVQKNDKKNIFKILPTFGFDSVEIVQFSNNNVKVKIQEQNFEILSKKIFPKDYLISNNEIKIGIINGLLKKTIKKNNISISTKQDRNSLYVTYIVKN